MNDNSLLPQEIVILLASVCIGTGIITLPKILAKAAGPDGLWALCGTLLVVSIGAWMLVALARQYPNESIAKYSPKLLGKPLGFAFNCLFTLYFFYVTAAVLRSFSDIVADIILSQTPLEVIMASMLIACSLIARNGIRPIARATQIIIFTFFFYLFLIPFLWNTFEFGEFLPLLYSSKESFLNAMVMSIFSIIGFEIVLVIAPYLKNKKKLLPGTLVGLGIVGFISITTVVMCFGTLTVRQTATFNYPVFEMIKYMPVPLLILERVELIFFTVWIASTYSTLVILLFSNALHLSEVINVKDHKHLVWPLCIIIFFLARLPSNVKEVAKYVDYINYVWLALVFGMVPLLLLIAKIKQPKSPKSPKKHVAKSKK